MSLKYESASFRIIKENKNAVIMLNVNVSSQVASNAIDSQTAQPSISITCSPVNSDKVKIMIKVLTRCIPTLNIEMMFLMFPVSEMTADVTSVMLFSFSNS